MDFFAVASIGSYPTPIPTNEERMAFIATYGLWDVATIGSLPSGGISKGLNQLGLSLTVT